MAPIVNQKFESEYGGEGSSVVDIRKDKMMVLESGVTRKRQNRFKSEIRPVKRLKRSTSIDSFISASDNQENTEATLLSRQLILFEGIKENVIKIANLTTQLFTKGKEINDEFVSLFQDSKLTVESLTEAIDHQKTVLTNSMNNLYIWRQKLENLEKVVKTDCHIREKVKKELDGDEAPSVVAKKGVGLLSLKKTDDIGNLTESSCSDLELASISVTNVLQEQMVKTDPVVPDQNDISVEKDLDTAENDDIETASIFSQETVILDEKELLNYAADQHATSLCEKTETFIDTKIENDLESDKSFVFDINSLTTGASSHENVVQIDDESQNDGDKDHSNVASPLPDELNEECAENIIEENKSDNDNDGDNVASRTLSEELELGTQSTDKIEFMKLLEMQKINEPQADEDCEEEEEEEATLEEDIDKAFAIMEEEEDDKDDVMDNIFNVDSNDTLFTSSEEDDELKISQVVCSPKIPSRSEISPVNSGTDTKIFELPDPAGVIIHNHLPTTVSNNINENDTTSEGNKKTDTMDHQIQSCSVVLEKLNENMCKNTHNTMDDEMKELERLLNLDSLERKKNFSTSTTKKDRRKKKKDSKLLNNLSENEMDNSSDDDNDSVCSTKSSSPVSDFNVNALSATDMIDALLRSPNGDSDSSDDNNNDDDTDIEKENKKNKKKSTVSGEEDDSKSQKDSKVQLSHKERSKWRNDPLLRGRLSESSSDDDGNVEDDSIISKALKEKFETRKKKIQNGSILRKEKLDSTDSLDDSDVEFISETKKKAESLLKSKVKSPVLDDTDSDDTNFNDDDSGVSNMKKGRKNIREILSDEILDEATKRANLIEKQRKDRLSQKQKEMDDILSKSIDLSQEQGLILDVDETTKEPTIIVNAGLTNQLKSHQKDGIRFMWDSCYESVKRIKMEGSGCILAHCMGLGKTRQVITLIHTLFTHRVTNTKYILIVSPLSVVLNWMNEFKITLKHRADDVPLSYISEHSSNRKERLYIVDQWRQKKGVLILGYESYVRLVSGTKHTDLTLQEVNVRKVLVNPGPDLVVIDEGHLLKNGKNCRTIALTKVRTKRRIILTGTPLQNNLKEYYHMVNFVKPNLLGSYKEYTNRFVNPITNGQYDDSTEWDIIKMKRRSHVLHKMLRGTVQRYEVSELCTYLPEKFDYVLFVQLHPVQVALYQKYIELLRSDEKEIKGKLFSHYHQLQLIWTHPYTLHLKEQLKRQKKKIPKEMDVINLDPEVPDNELPDDWWYYHCPEDFKVNISYGPKFEIMMSIIQECQTNSDKLLIFSSSLLELDVVEYFLKLTFDWKINHNYYRMDGRVLPEARLQLCNSFNDSKNKTVRAMLISHKVGGLGLNLIAANRVILLDVSWNPAYDSQSIFRMYRFGQSKKCYVYRLVSMGTMEEVVYERQVTKLAIAGRVVDEMQISRHYKSNDLQKMYRVNFDLDMERPVLPIPSDSVLRTILLGNTSIFKYHEHQSLLENLPDEELNEDEMKQAWDEFNKENEQQKEMQEMQKRRMLMIETTSVAPVVANADGVINSTSIMVQPGPSDINTFLPNENTNVDNTPKTNVETYSNVPLLPPQFSSPTTTAVAPQRFEFVPIRGKENVVVKKTPQFVPRPSLTPDPNKTNSNRKVRRRFFNWCYNNVQQNSNTNNSNMDMNQINSNTASSLNSTITTPRNEEVALEYRELISNLQSNDSITLSSISSNKVGDNTAVIDRANDVIQID